MINAHRVETTLTQDRTLTLEGLPFQAGDTVEVIVLERAASDGDTTSEAEQVADWLTASRRSLREIWDNDEDSVYDHL